jgi:predicted GNAT family acetyltransferase
VKSLGLPMHVQPESPVIFCTYVSPGYGRKGIGRQLIEAAKKAFHDQPGLLVMSTKTRMYMPIARFEKLGFRMVHSHDLWRIGYLPIGRDDIQIDFYNPELEWDYVNPFTLVQGGFCPFMLHIWKGQRKAAQSFRKYAPVEVMTLEEARKKDPNVVQGFYVFGKLAPAKPMFGWQFKKYIRKAIRTEETKTFGAASKTSYEKRK